MPRVPKAKAPSMWASRTATIMHPESQRFDPRSRGTLGGVLHAQHNTARKCPTKDRLLLGRRTTSNSSDLRTDDAHPNSIDHRTHRSSSSGCCIISIIRDLTQKLRRHGALILSCQPDAWRRRKPGIVLQARTPLTIKGISKARPLEARRRGFIPTQSFQLGPSVYPWVESFGVLLVVITHECAVRRHEPWSFFGPNTAQSKTQSHPRVDRLSVPYLRVWRSFVPRRESGESVRGFISARCSLKLDELVALYGQQVTFRRPTGRQL